MGQLDYILVTNNPMVYEKYKDTRNVIYKEVSYEDTLKEVRNKIHEGHELLSHPLSGSVKPNETPYKTVMVSSRKKAIDLNGLEIIESAILACQKFEFKSDKYKPEVYEDFQIIDCGLIESGMSSADLI